MNWNIHLMDIPVHEQHDSDHSSGINHLSDSVSELQGVQMRLHKDEKVTQGGCSGGPMCLMTFSYTIVRCTLE